MILCRLNWRVQYFKQTSNLFHFQFNIKSNFMPLWSRLIPFKSKVVKLLLIQRYHILTKKDNKEFEKIENNK